MDNENIETSITLSYNGNEETRIYRETSKYYKGVFTNTDYILKEDITISVLGTVMNRELKNNEWNSSSVSIKKYLDLCIENKHLFNMNNFEYIKKFHIGGTARVPKEVIVYKKGGYKIADNFYNSYKGKQVSLNDTLNFIIKQGHFDDIYERQYTICGGYSTLMCSFSIATIDFALKNNKIVKKCELCGKYFFPVVRSDERFCDFQSEQYENKTCKQANELIKKKKYLSTNEVQKVYKRIYNLIYQRNDCSPSSELDNFINDSRIWKKEIKEQVKTEHEYLQWLNSFYVTKQKA